MNKAALTVGLTAMVAFAAGYATRGGVKSEAAPAPEAAAKEMKVAVRQVIPASHGPGMRDVSGGSFGQMSGQRAFPKGEVAKWLEGLKDIDPEDAVAMAQLCRKCWAMDEEEAAELLAKCGEILPLQDDAQSPGIANFPQSEVMEVLALQAGMRLAKVAPASALAVIRESERLRDDNEVIYAIFAVIAEGDLSLALESAKSLESRFSAIGGIMQKIAPGDLIGAERLLELSPDDGEIVKWYLRRVADVDLDLAASKAYEMAASGYPDALSILLYSLVAREKAVEWVMDFQGPNAERISKETVLALMSPRLSDAEAAYARLEARLSPEFRKELAVTVAMSKIHQKGGWESWLQSLDGETRQATLITLVNPKSMAELFPITPASGMVDGQVDDPFLIGGFVRGSLLGPAELNSLSRAMELLGQISPTPEAQEQMATRVRKIVDSDPDQARILVAKMLEGPEKASLAREAEMKSELKALELQLEKSRAAAQGENEEITPDD